MLRATPPLTKMASTHGGMRRILKKRLPVQKYIELAIKEVLAKDGTAEQPAF